MEEVNWLPHHSKGDMSMAETESLWASDLGNTVTGTYMRQNAQAAL